MNSARSIVTVSNSSLPKTASLSGLVSDNTPIVIKSSVVPTVNTTIPSMPQLSTTQTPDLQSLSSANMIDISSAARTGQAAIGSQTPVSRVPFSTLNSSVQIPSSPVRINSASLKDIRSDVLPVSNAEDRIINDDIEAILTKYEYAPVERIFTKSDDGQIIGQYIKAISPSGSTVFIDADVDGVLAIRPDDMQTVEITSNQAVEIPIETKNGLLNCAGNGVCGVAFECDNGICTVVRKQNMQPNETQFVKVSRVGDEAAIVGVNPYAITIVKLSEIIANPGEVNKEISKANMRILKASFEQCHNNIDSMKEARDTLSSEIERLDNNMNVARDNLNKSLDILLEFDDTYHSTTNPLPAAELSKERRVVQEIQARYELYHNLLNLCTTLHSKTDELYKLCDDLRNTNKIIRSDYSSLNKPLVKRA